MYEHIFINPSEITARLNPIQTALPKMCQLQSHNSAFCQKDGAFLNRHRKTMREDIRNSVFDTERRDPHNRCQK